MTGDLDLWAAWLAAEGTAPGTVYLYRRRLSTLLGAGWSGHSLRHRYASAVYAGSRDILALQDLLGHSSPETTRRYVDTGRQARWEAARHAA